MATSAQRWQAYCDALLNKTATVAQQTRLGEAIALHANNVAAYNAMTTAAKLVFCLDFVRTLNAGWVKTMDAAATIEANRAKTIADISAASAAVDAEFAPTP